MTISRVGTQAGGTFADSATSISRAFGSNVTAGNVVWFAATVTDNHTFVAGDLTKSAGTATLDTIRLVHQRAQDMVGYFVSNALWCAKVTGSGSLTLQAGGAAAGSYWVAASGEITSTIGFDSNPIETQNANGTGTDSSSPATTGNGTSAGGAYFLAMLGVGCPGVVTITLGGSFSTAYNESSGAHMVGEASDRIVSAGTTDQGSWTLAGTTDGWCAVLGVIKESASAPALNPQDGITGSKRNRPGRGPYSRGKYARPLGETARPAPLIATGAAGLAAETDAALSIAAVQIRVVGLSVEVDAALALTGVVQGQVGLAAESDTALALSAVQIRSTGLSTETDTALALLVGAAAAVETAAANRPRPGRGPYSLGRYYRPLGETAQPAQLLATVGLSVEVDTALALAGVAQSSSGLAAEVDTAVAQAGLQLRPVGLAIESDAAVALEALTIRPVGLAAEADSALSLAATQVMAVGRADESDSSLALAGAQLRAAGLAVEGDLALALSPSTPGAAGVAVEVDTALALAGVQKRTVGLAQESDAAFALALVQARSVGVVSEADAAFALAAVQRLTVGMASESDTAFALESVGTLILSATSAAQLFDVWQRLGLDPANPLTITQTAELAGGVALAVSEVSGVVTHARAPYSLPRTQGTAAHLLDIWQRLGLDPDNPQSTTATSIAAGGVAQSINEAPGPVVTVTRSP